MSDWDEEAGDEARSRVLGASQFAMDMRGQMVGMARWQREALLSDEAVERAARGIQASHDRGDWDEELPVVQDEYRDMARTAFAAAIGDE